MPTFGDEVGLLWEDQVRSKTRAGRALPPIPDTGWTPPDEFPGLEGHGRIAIDCETYDPQLKTKGPGAHRDGYIAGVAIGTEAGFTGYYPIAHKDGPNFHAKHVLGWLDHELSREGQPKVGANLLYDLDYLTRAGVRVSGPFYDVQVAEPLLDENRLSYDLDSIAATYLGQGKGEVQDQMTEWLERAFGKGNVKGNIWRAPPAVVGPYAEGDVTLPLAIFARQAPLLEAEGMWELFERVESRLIWPLLRMRQRGVRVDVEGAEREAENMGQRRDEAIREIKRQTAVAPNLWEPESLARVFDAVGLDYPRTEKKGAPSFRKDWLKQQTHPIAQLINDARQADKLQNTFINGYILDGHVDGRIHGSFHQLRGDEGGTVTGRFSSCLPSYVPIGTSQGSKPLGDVEPGEHVWTHTGAWRRVRAKWCNGTQPVYRVTLENGASVECTSNHRLLTDRGWLSLEDMGYGTRDRRGVSTVGQADSGGRGAGGTPQLHRKPGGKARLSAPGGDMLCPGADRDTRGVRSTPHQRGQDGQPPSQPRPRVASGSPRSAPLFSPIRDVDTLGVARVYDLEVEQDHCFLAGDIFVHNSSPNLQNLPPNIRHLFLPEAGQRWWRFDWSQIEYRLIVHYAALIGATGADKAVDLYSGDSDVDFHQALADMTGLTRKDAKNLNFGLAYGQGVKLLCSNLGVDLNEGRGIINEYHRRAPFVRELMDAVTRRASRRGEVRTLLGRKRRFELWEKEGQILSEHVPGAQRAFTHKSLNSLIQGSAADIMKQAMVDYFDSGALDVLGPPHLTVHDELDGSFQDTAEAREALQHVRHIMEGCVDLRVPLKADQETGDNWRDVG